LLALARTFRPPLVGPSLGLLLLLGLRETNAVLEGLQTRPRRNRDDRENCSGKDKAVTCHCVSSPLIAKWLARRDYAWRGSRFGTIWQAAAPDMAAK
jgi:hypothetical protein